MKVFAPTMSRILQTKPVAGYVLIPILSTASNDACLNASFSRCWMLFPDKDNKSSEARDALETRKER